jgi:hypothetical protein
MEKTVIREGGTMGAVYGFAFLGALVYYLQHATTFVNGIVGIFKAVFWPGFVLYRVLELLKM